MLKRKKYFNNIQNYLVLYSIELFVYLKNTRFLPSSEFFMFYIHLKIGLLLIKYVYKYVVFCMFAQETY